MGRFASRERDVQRPTRRAYPWLYRVADQEQRWFWWGATSFTPGHADVVLRSRRAHELVASRSRTPTDSRGAVPASSAPGNDHATKRRNGLHRDASVSTARTDGDGRRVIGQRRARRSTARSREQNTAWVLHLYANVTDNSGLSASSRVTSNVNKSPTGRTRVVTASGGPSLAERPATFTLSQRPALRRNRARPTVPVQ